MNKVIFTNIVRNEDGTYNFSEAQYDVNGNLVSSGNEVNIILGDDFAAGLKARVADNLIVEIEGIDSTGNAGFEATHQAVAESAELPTAPVEPTV